VAAHFAGDTGEFYFSFLSVSVSFRIRVSVSTWDFGMKLFFVYPRESKA
jgi:hypothetical protein